MKISNHQQLMANTFVSSGVGALAGSYAPWIVGSGAATAAGLVGGAGLVTGAIFGGASALIGTSVYYITRRMMTGSDQAESRIAMLASVAAGFFGGMSITNSSLVLLGLTPLALNSFVLLAACPVITFIAIGAIFYTIKYVEDHKDQIDHQIHQACEAVTHFSANLFSKA